MNGKQNFKQMRLLIIIFFLNLSQLIAQGKDTYIGIKIAPSYYAQQQVTKGTGIRKFVPGYGFNTSLSTKFIINDFSATNIELGYEYFAFDQTDNNVLLTSLRLNTINIDFAYNLAYFENWFANLQLGSNFIIKSEELASNIWLSAKDDINKTQVYLGFGTSTMLYVTDHIFEVGVHSKYFITKLWHIKGSHFNSNVKTNLLTAELTLKYLF